jgi:hypothetical protein
MRKNRPVLEETEYFEALKELHEYTNDLHVESIDPDAWAGWSVADRNRLANEMEATAAALQDVASYMRPKNERKTPDRS